MIPHGFFAIMGSLVAYEGNRPIRVLLPEQLESYSLMSKVSSSCKQAGL
jgi:hypothetical protein